jgi:hypothetical protein
MEYTEYAEDGIYGIYGIRSSRDENGSLYDVTGENRSDTQLSLNLTLINFRYISVCKHNMHN